MGQRQQHSKAKTENVMGQIQERLWGNARATYEAKPAKLVGQSQGNLWGKTKESYAAKPRNVMGQNQGLESDKDERN